MLGLDPSILFATAKEDRRVEPGDDESYMECEVQPFVPFSTSTYFAIATAVGEKSWR